MTTSRAPQRGPAPPTRNPPVDARATCERCKRPVAWCWCAHVPQLHAKTRVVFLQHPRERNVAIGTARMAHLALAGSQLVSPRGEGLTWDALPAIADVFAPDAHAAVLFPGDGARDVYDWVNDTESGPPRTLVVVDGTWSQAKKLLKLNPRLAALPRVSYRPPAPGNYRIRKEPSDECLATIEAVSAVLGILEGRAEEFSALLTPFTHMVDRQLEAIRASTGARHRRRSTGPAALPAELVALLEHPERVVIIYAEANACPRDARVPGKPEVLHVVATRPHAHATGVQAERIEVLFKPRRALSESTAARIGVSADVLHASNGLDEGLARVRAFLGEATWVTWGPYPRDLLAQEGEPKRGFVDLRALAARALRASPGGIEPGAQSLGVVVADADRVFSGRGGRMLATLEGVYAELVKRAKNA